MQFVSRLQPLLYFPIDLFHGSDRNAVRDAVFFCQSARVDQPLRQFSFVVRQRESKIDSRIRRRLDLRKNVLAIQSTIVLPGHAFTSSPSDFPSRSNSS